MGQQTIWPNGEREITVPLGEKIAISNYGGGLAEIFSKVYNAGNPDYYSIDQRIENSSVVLGPYSRDQEIRIEANGSKVIFDVGADPAIPGGSGGALTDWEDAAGVFRPIVSGAGQLGDATHLIGGLYLGDNDIAYFGDGQDFQIYHDGSASRILTNTGSIVVNSVPGSLFFQTGSVTRWRINTGGVLQPDSTYGLGAATSRIGTVFATNTDLPDNGIASFGDDDDLQIYHDGAAGFITCNTGVLTINNLAAGNGATGSIDTTATQTITVTNGIITAIV